MDNGRGVQGFPSKFLAKVLSAGTRKGLLPIFAASRQVHCRAQLFAPTLFFQDSEVQHRGDLEKVSPLKQRG
jgi:hypothetical protein